MPEGPEIKHIVDQLNNLLDGAILKDVVVINGPHKKFSEDITKDLKPVLKNKNNIIKIQKINCKGKFIYFQLILYKSGVAKAAKFIGNHLGMTGHWRKDEGKHTMVKLVYIPKGEINTLSERVLWFDDMRHFAKFNWFTKEQLLEKLKKLGPDVLNPKFTENIFNKIIKLKDVQNKMIGNVIVDQAVFSGIGNYLRADILYTAQIHPRKKIKDINSEHLKALYRAMREITLKAYQEHGTTIRTYKDIEMQPGNYDPIIYDKEKDPLGNPVDTMTLGGRTMWYVPAIQKL